MTKYDDPEYLDRLRRSAAQQSATGNYWAGKTLALLDLLIAARSDSVEAYSRGYRSACEDWGIKSGM